MNIIKIGVMGAVNWVVYLRMDHTKDSTEAGRVGKRVSVVNRYSLSIFTTVEKVLRVFRNQGKANVWVLDFMGEQNVLFSPV